MRVHSRTWYCCSHDSFAVLPFACFCSTCLPEAYAARCGHFRYSSWISFFILIVIRFFGSPDSCSFPVPSSSLLPFPFLSLLFSFVFLLECSVSGSCPVYALRFLPLPWLSPCVEIPVAIVSVSFTLSTPISWKMTAAGSPRGSFHVRESTNRSTNQSIDRS